MDHQEQLWGLPKEWAELEMGTALLQEQKGRSGSKGSLHQRGERSVVAQMDTGAQKMHRKPCGRAGFTGRKE